MISHSTNSMPGYFSASYGVAVISTVVPISAGISLPSPRVDFAVPPVTVTVLLSTEAGML